MSGQQKIILGIDPGTQILGYGLIKGTPSSFSYIGMGVVDLRKISDHFERISEIFRRVDELIREYTPDEMAIEAPFYGKNIQSMLKLGRAQGAAISSALNHSLPVHEYAPRKIKMAITGKGAASKEQVANILSKILNIDSIPKHLDATDGLAVALCHLLSSGSIVKNSNSKSGWDAFVRNNPSRIK